MMGAWGSGPFDNDTAGDLIAGFMKPVRFVASGEADPPPLSRTAAKARRLKRKKGLLLPPREKRRLSDDQRRDFYYAARVAIALCLPAYRTDILGGFSLDICEDALRVMLDDSTWLASWRDPFEVQRSLQQQLLLVQLKKMEAPRSAAVDLWTQARERLTFPSRTTRQKRRGRMLAIDKKRAPKRKAKR